MWDIAARGFQPTLKTKQKLNTDHPLQEPSTKHRNLFMKAQYQLFTVHEHD